MKESEPVLWKLYPLKDLTRVVELGLLGLIFTILAPPSTSCLAATLLLSNQKPKVVQLGWDQRVLGGLAFRS